MTNDNESILNIDVFTKLIRVVYASSNVNSYKTLFLYSFYLFMK